MVRRAVLPGLVKLLGCAAVREGVPGALAALLDDCPALHRAAADADAIGRLAAFLQDERCSPRLKARWASKCDTLPCAWLRWHAAVLVTYDTQCYHHHCAGR